MFPKPVQAVYDIDNSGNPLSRFRDFADILNVVLPMMYIIAAFGFLAMLLYGSFTMLTSGGDAEKVMKAKKTITYTIIGLIVVVCAVLIVNLISFILGVDLLPQ